LVTRHCGCIEVFSQDATAAYIAASLRLSSISVDTRLAKAQSSRARKARPCAPAIDDVMFGST
jgi:hypothetical protein